MVVGQPGDVDEAVDATQVDERAKAGYGGDPAGDLLAWF